MLLLNLAERIALARCAGLDPLTVDQWIASNASHEENTRLARAFSLLFGAAPPHAPELTRAPAALARANPLVCT